MLDTNQDGAPDFVVFTAPVSGADGPELVYSFDLNDPDAVPTAFFYADNGTNDANTLLTICGEQIGMNADELLRADGHVVGAYDNFFTGNLTDSIDGITVAPLGERYLGLFDPDCITSGDVPGDGSLPMTVVDCRTGLRQPDARSGCCS